MISCLLIHVDHNSQGVPINKESAVSGEFIQIGRGPSCKIHLADHRVHLLHATVRRSEDGTLYIDGEKDAVMDINGFIEQSAALSPDTKLIIGPYLLTVVPDIGEHDIALSVEMLQPLTEVSSDEVPVTLASLGLSKRKLGLLGALSVFLIFLLFPLLTSVSPELDKWQSQLPITLTGSWNPGPLSGGHNMFGAQCSVCHKQPFTAITDEVCEGCHKQLKQHGKDGALASKQKHIHCTSCHIDHKGDKGLVRHDPSHCVACHGNIKASKSTSTLANIHSFDEDHPAFKLSLQQGEKLIRVVQDKKSLSTETPGLKYSHKVHLDKEGVSSPRGDTLMTCSDCHKLDDAGTRFKPMTMEESCQQSGCHKQYFTEPVEGNVPHGDERAVMDKIRMFYTQWLSDNPANKRLCANVGDNINVVKCANELARRNAGSSLFSTDYECGECHEITSSGDDKTPWKMARVNINRDWQPGAIFAHNKHNTMECTTCHDKLESDNSADIAMPTIEKCRTCHGDKHEKKGKIISHCDSCHRFHHEVKNK